MSGRPEEREFKNASRSESKGKYKCFLCRKKCHFESDCPEKKKMSIEKHREAGDADVVSDGSEFAEVLMVSKGSSNKEWVIDSGSSFHMCPDQSVFFDYKKIDGGQVLLGNNYACSIVGLGSVKFQMKDRTRKVLQQGRHVPELKRNLISIGVLDDKSFLFKIENRNLMIMIKGSQVVMKGLKRNDMCVFQGKVVTGKSATVQTKKCARESATVQTETSERVKLWN